jgi:hypothetical protein
LDLCDGPIEDGHQGSWAVEQSVRLHLVGPGRKLTRAHRSLAVRLLLSSRRDVSATVSHAYAVTLKRHP